MSLEADMALVDQANELVAFFKAHKIAINACRVWKGEERHTAGPVSAVFHTMMNDYMATLLNTQVSTAQQWMRFVMCGHKVTFSPDQVPLWDEFTDYTMDYTLAWNSKWPEVDYTIELVRIARQHGPQAAMLYKLSGGNMKPKGGDA